MSHVHEGPLATYNSLTDQNLSGYFGNTRMRKQLRRAGLVNRRGELITENQYRVNMARKEHKKHVKDLLAQAIVHKTLDLERYRQVEIKKKLEEIAKIELVRRVREEQKKRQDDCLMPLITKKKSKKHVRNIHKSVVPLKTSATLIDMERSEMKDNLCPSSATRHSATRGRKGDEEVLPYLTPRSQSRPQSERPSEASSSGRNKRPKSAPAPPRQPRGHHPKSGYTDTYDDIHTDDNSYKRLVIYVDDDGRPVSPPPPSDRQSMRDLRADNIDTRHLYALDSEALQQYAMRLSRSERGRDGSTSPYLISQIPTPPKHERAKSARSPRRSARMSARPDDSHRRPGGVKIAYTDSSKKDPNTVEGALMLHRQEPAMMHQGEVQTLCEITMKYHGPNLTLPRDQRDPTQEVAIDQQHCGGNTLPVFKERLQAGSSFSFISRRHRGYPFSLTMYIDGRVDCRVSTCCEYKHAVGVKLGGKMGHFSLTGITGATPCYKCKLGVQAPPRSLKLKKSTPRKKKPEPSEEVTVEGTPRTPVVEKEISGKSDEEENCESEKHVVIPVEDEISKTENSCKTSKKANRIGRKDKFTRGKQIVPAKPTTSKSTSSKSVNSKSRNFRPSSAKKLEGKYEQVKVESDKTESDSGKDTCKSLNSEKDGTTNVDNVQVNGLNTEKTAESGVKHDDDHNQDTDYEVEEDIFSEKTDRTNDRTKDDEIEENIVERSQTETKDESIKEELAKTESIKEELDENSKGSSSVQSKGTYEVKDDAAVGEAGKTVEDGSVDGEPQSRPKSSLVNGKTNDYEEDFEEEDSKDGQYEDDFEDDNVGDNGDDIKKRSD